MQVSQMFMIGRSSFFRLALAVGAHVHVNLMSCEEKRKKGAKLVIILK